MTDHGAEQRAGTQVGQLEVGAGLPDDAAERRVVHMGNLGEEMVFHLVIQTAGEEGDELIAGRKIGRDGEFTM